MPTHTLGTRIRHDERVKVTISMDRADHDRITAFASAKGWTLSYFLRTLALRYVARESKGKP